MTDELLVYDIAPEVEAFSTRRDCVLPYPVIQAHQTHSVNVAVIDRDDYTREQLEGVDAMVTNLRGVAIGIRTADCLPVFLYDPVNHAIGAAHSGWRGTINKIANWTIRAMTLNYGSKPKDLIAVVGPGIGADAFQVGEEVAQLFKQSGFPVDRIWSFRGPRTEGSMAGGHHIDLHEVVKITLTESGIPEENIHMTGICTYQNEEFFSARREGRECGRIINSIKLI
ncbi:MAG: peptidoglycan editing factor PgeF [Bacteroidales bacterium]|nr:peptidoglycan editing factor PgeF [Bacteroidales bacterium]